MKKANEELIDLVKSNFESNKTVKTVVYLVSAAAILYMAGKMFSMLAGSVRGFNEFRSALKGN
jgi:hypothetical protein